MGLLVCYQIFMLTIRSSCLLRNRDAQCKEMNKLEMFVVHLFFRAHLKLICFIFFMFVKSGINSPPQAEPRNAA